MDDLHQTVWDRLNEGYGAEDIAVLDGLPIEDVRACIRHFRAQPKKLPALYGRARKVWRGQCKTPA